MIKELLEKYNDNTLKITITEKEVYIINYKDILVFEDNQVLVQTNTKLIKVKGSNLTITKLESSEVLIEGKIILVELGD